MIDCLKNERCGKGTQQGMSQPRVTHITNMKM
jgi:hypothetical protein